MSVSLTQEEYEALVSLARRNLSDDAKRKLNDFLLKIEAKNGIHRSFLWVQWQETGKSLPPTTKFPDVWPPEMRVSIERTDRPIARADVQKVLASRAKRPTNILVTRDPGAELGWMALDDYFR